MITVVGAEQSGGTIHVRGPKGFILRKFDWIQISGVHPTNPQTKRLIPVLDKIFEVRENCELSGDVDALRIHPNILGSGQYQNVYALPADGAEVMLYSSGKDKKDLQ